MTRAALIFAILAMPVGAQAGVVWTGPPAIEAWPVLDEARQQEAAELAPGPAMPDRTIVASECVAMMGQIPAAMLCARPGVGYRVEWGGGRWLLVRSWDR